MAQISATVKDKTIEVVDDMAKEGNHTFSRMVDILLTKSAAEWILEKSKTDKKKKTKSLS